MTKSENLLKTIQTLKEQLQDCEKQLAASKKDKEGLYMALVAKGVQDYWTDQNEFYVDCKNIFQNETYQMVYDKLAYDTTIRNNYINFKIKSNCDLINNIDLIIPNPQNKRLNSLIKSISCEYGTVIDRLNASDLETQINTNCSFLGAQRKISYSNDKIFIPLVMAPFNNHNLVQPKMENHELNIIVDFHEFMYDMYTIELMGCMYAMKSDKLKRITDGYNFITIQNQYTGVEHIHGTSHSQHSFTIHFMQPTYLLYFWGFDKSLVKNVKLLLNGYTFYDGSLDALEFYKISRGFKDVEPSVIFFTDQNDLTQSNKCSVNFSRIDSSKLLIQTSQSDFDMNIIGLSMMPVRCLKGMIGMA